MENIILEGAISVKAALEAESRPVFEIYIDKKKYDKNLAYIIHLAEKREIPVFRVEKLDIEKLTSGTSHGGIAAMVGERKTVLPEELLEEPLIALLEGIEDPYNFGGSIRSLYAAGFTGLIIPKRNWLYAAGVVTKASAGASEYIKTSAVEDFGHFLALAKSRGYSVICADRKDAVSLYEADLKQSIILAVGGEMRGLSKQVYDAADTRIFIPYGSPFRNSLSAASACTVIAFEILRQKNAKC